MADPTAPLPTTLEDSHRRIRDLESELAKERGSQANYLMDLQASFDAQALPDLRRARALLPRLEELAALAPRLRALTDNMLEGVTRESVRDVTRGFDAIAARTRADADADADADASSKPSSVDDGRVRVFGAPIGGIVKLGPAQASVDNADATTLEIDPGSHELVIEARGFETHRETLTVEPGRTRTVRVNMQLDAASQQRREQRNSASARVQRTAANRRR